ncbi:MAG: FAD-binding oxidoreductase, partial [Actinomycetota bacterium]
MTRADEAAAASLDDVAAALRGLIGDEGRVSTDGATLDSHSGDISHHPPQRPAVVVYPKGALQVGAVVGLAAARALPLVPYGKGTSVECHIIPATGAVSLDLGLMDHVLEVRPDDLVARVEAGVTRKSLNRHLQRFGLFFPVDPGADATLGGMAATNASGTSAVRYGTMRDNVAGLEVVLADGRIITTGGMSVKSSAGYNLTALFVGSEGTLGVITELTLRLQRIPERVVAARAVFDEVEPAVGAAMGLLESGMAIGRVELVDDLTMRAVNRYESTAFDERPTLFLEFAGKESAVLEDASRAEGIAREHGCASFEAEADEEGRRALWRARHRAALALMDAAPGKKLMTTDVCVPVSELPGAIRHARSVVDQHGVEGAVLG